MMKNKSTIIKKLFLILTITVVIISPVLPNFVLANGETILGVPIHRFDEINHSKTRLEESISIMSNSENSIGYVFKYKHDSFSYAYNIMKVHEELGNNKTETIVEHINTYNSSIRPPLSDEDRINITIGEGNLNYTVESTANEFLGKLINLTGHDQNTISDPTIYGVLKYFRYELGYTEALVTGSTHKDTSKTNEQQIEFINKNVSEIRFVLSSIKDYLIDYESLLPDSAYNAVADYFIDTYDKIIMISIENNIETISTLDLFSDSISEEISSGSESAHEYLGTWTGDEGKENLTEYSEYILKGIAASSTFRPFETDLDTLSAFSFLGEEMHMFHSQFGTKRKLLLTNANEAMDLKSSLDTDKVKSFKYITLKDFIKNTDEIKALYIDKLPYLMSDIENIQSTTKGESTSEDIETSSEDMNTAISNSEDLNWKDKAKLFMAKTSPVIAKPVINKLANPFDNNGDMASHVIWISANTTEVSKTSKDLKEKFSDITLAYLTINNIVEEYYGAKESITMRNDLNKPLYVDIYGNIVSASGIVIIPAVNNPFYFKDDEPFLMLNTAFIESYPEFKREGDTFEVLRKDKKKLALYAFNGKDNTTKEIPSVELSPTLTGNLGELPDGELNGISYYASSASSPKYKASNEVEGIRLVANKYDDVYNAIKAIDVFNFAVPKDMEGIKYDNLINSVKAMPNLQNRLFVNEYTISLNSVGSTEIVTFKDVPNSDELKRFIYISNLENIAKIEGNDIKDKGVLSSIHAHKTTQEIYINGIYDLSTINELAPKVILTLWQEFKKFLLEQANERYEVTLGNGIDNNILYNKPIDEIDSMKTFLPLLYKIILLISIVAIALNIIMTIAVKEDKWRQILKVLSVMYIMTFLISFSSIIMEYGVNKPIKWMYSKDTAYWTLIEQEKSENRIQLKTEESVDILKAYDTTSLALYNIPVAFPYKTLGSNDNGYISLDEYYEHYLIDDGRFRAQNNEMYVDGKKVLINTDTIFKSSSIEVGDEDNILKPLVHNIFYSPELAYYLPYYMFIDNIVYNINSYQKLYAKIPVDLAYTGGNTKTTGRLSNYISSSLFLDYDGFIERLNEYESSDRVSTELSISSIKSILDEQGSNQDFLGISKILHLDNNINITPFTENGLRNVSITGWYPQLDRDNLTNGEKKKLQKKAERVNNRVKRFTVNLINDSDKIADEHLIKTIALYASLQFNKEFSEYALNKTSFNLETKDVDLETLMMATTVSREGMIKSNILSYPYILSEQSGTLGLLMSTANDYLILFINYIKPFFMAMLWIMVGVVIFVKKVILPDPNNRSIVGSLKMILLYCVTSIVYALALKFVIYLSNTSINPLVNQSLLLVFNIIYLAVILYMLYVLVVDWVNIGGTVVLKSLDKAVSSVGKSVANTVNSSGIARKILGRHADQFENKASSMASRFGKSASERSSEIGVHNFMEPINLMGDSVKHIQKNISENYNNVKTSINKSKGDISARRSKEVNQSNVQDNSTIDISKFEQGSLGPLTDSYLKSNKNTNLDLTKHKEPTTTTQRQDDAVDYLNNKK